MSLFSMGVWIEVTARREWPVLSLLDDQNISLLPLASPSESDS
jgi:hypothetical protein